jgi:hypothetical protein
MVLLDEVNFKLVNLFPPSLRKYFDPRVAYPLYKYLKRHNITTCIVNHPFQGLLAYVACRLAGVHFVVYSHNIEYLRFRSFGKWWWSHAIYYLEKLVYRLSKLVFFISENEKEIAIENFRLLRDRCHFLPHLIPTRSAPQRLPPSGLFTIIFFSDYTYGPNRVALDNILFKIKPLLDKRKGFSYSLIICGRGLSRSYVDQYIKNDDNLKYLGFIQDLNSLLIKADVFLNPVLAGGGVQTKSIQALAAGATVISSESGARGIKHNACGSKLVTVPNLEWQKYADQIFLLYQTEGHLVETPQSFYDVYFSENVISRITRVIYGLGAP